MKSIFKWVLKISYKHKYVHVYSIGRWIRNDKAKEQNVESRQRISFEKKKVPWLLVQLLCKYEIITKQKQASV